MVSVDVMVENAFIKHTQRAASGREGQVGQRRRGAGHLVGTRDRGDRKAG